jgi:hypothetical protein
MKGDLKIKLVDGRTITKRRRFFVLPTDTGAEVVTTYYVSDAFTPESLTFTITGLTALLDDVLGTTCGNDDAATVLSMNFAPDALFVTGASLRLCWKVAKKKR